MNPHIMVRRRVKEELSDTGRQMLYTAGEIMIEETWEMRYGGKDYLIQSKGEEKIENGMNIKGEKRKENIQIGVVSNSLKAS